MLRIIVVLGVVAGFVFGLSPSVSASDPCCFGRTEKNVTGVCVVTKFQEGSICMEEVPDGKPKGCWGLSGCFQLKDLGGAKVGDHVIVTGWRVGDMKCYQGPNCGKVSVTGSGKSK